MAQTDISKASALRFVILMGVVSFFADMTYEGARSITGPYLNQLGASAFVVGFVAGLGEFLGYGLRLFSGYFADKTHRYWFIAILGYAVNLFAVPLLALAGNWWIASLFIIAERSGKGIRKPASDAMISHAAQRMGMGWGFGLHEAMDQAGAMAGPLLTSFILYLNGHYQACFAILLIPALASLATVLFSSYQYPHPHHLEEQSKSIQIATLKRNKPFWIYVTGASLVALGYADFALIAYHFSEIHLFAPVWIPVIYAISLGVNVILAPLLGYWYDRKGFIVLIIMTLVASLFPILVFLGDPMIAVIGVVLWSIGLGAQGSLMRAILANMVVKDKRASAYGIFNAAFGLFWFIGSAVMGLLYDVSMLWLVIFSFAAQLLALPLLWQANRWLSKI